MQGQFYYDGRSYYQFKGRRKYGLGHLLFDFCLTMLTGGLWLIWILIKYLRTNSR